MAKSFANSADPDQMPHSAASDLGLHYFATYPFRGLQTTMGYFSTKSCLADTHWNCQKVHFDANHSFLTFLLSGPIAVCTGR